jgi:hypothetical protein
MPTYDIIGSSSGLSSAAGSYSVAPGPVVAGTAWGLSSGAAVGIATDLTVRGVMAGVSSGSTSLSWTRSISGVAAGVSRAAAIAYTKTIVVTASATATSTMTGRISLAHKGLLLPDVARAVYALWGYDGIQNLRTITIGRERIAEWCNAAMQLIYSQADRLEYFNRDRVTVTVGTGGSVALPVTVQRIHGEARIGGRSLRPLASKGQITDFTNLYGGSSPIGFLVESIRDTGADSLGMTLYVAPAPSEDTEVTLDVTYEPPRFESADLLSGQVIPLPHKWAETIFMPLVRKWAAGDGRMPASMRAAQIAEIDAQYAAARQMLGLADIDPVTVKDSKEGKAGS